MNMNDLGIMIDAAVRAALQAARAEGAPAAPPPAHAAHEGRTTLDERHFRRCDKLSGTNWKEFSFQFKTAVGSASPKIRDVLEQVAKSGKDNDWDLFFDLLPEWTDEEARKGGQEVYAALAALVTGDAMTVVRSVTNGNGWEAWSRLHNRFDPRTPAKALMMMMAVLQTRRAKDSRELPNMVQDWEVKVKNLDVEHEIKLDPKIKIALMTSFLPADLQDLVFQWSDDKTTFEGIRDKVMSLAVNRAAMAKPTAMEVDGVQAGLYYEEGWDYGEEEWSYEGEDTGINYVGEKCHRCGGLGHYARECGTPLKGKGKGEAGKGGGKAKGKGKGGLKGSGKGWKGKGKGGGFGGECWKCGERGHRQQDCPGNKTAMDIGNVETQDSLKTVGSVDVGVGGVWMISQVAVQDEPAEANKPEDFMEDPPARLPQFVSVQRRGFRPRPAGCATLGCQGCRPTGLTNRFEAFREDEENQEHMTAEADFSMTAEADFSMTAEADFSTKPIKVKRFMRTKKADTVINICPVEAAMEWAPAGAGEITVDSAAEESVCPKSWGEAFPMRRPSRWLRFVNASGGPMGHYGEKTAIFKAKGQKDIMSMGFQVSDVQKPLAAVWRIAERGNLIQFGPKDEDNFITNKETRKKIMMVRRNGSYVIEAEFVQQPGFPRQAEM